MRYFELFSIHVRSEDFVWKFNCNSYEKILSIRENEWRGKSGKVESAGKTATHDRGNCKARYDYEGV